jgi:diguanylate cyclase (GGDEF)-like protein
MKSDEELRLDVGTDRVAPNPPKESTRSRVSGELLTCAVAAVGDVAYCWMLEDDAIIWGAGAESLLGITGMSGISTNRTFAARIATKDAVNRYEVIMGSRIGDAGTGVPYELQYQVRDDFGGLRWIEDRGRWFANKDGQPYMAAGMLRAVDERRQREDKLLRLSTYDEQTGLLNRIRLKEAVAEALLETQRYRTTAAFLLIAIDNLALINDAFGFDVADAVIVGIGERLRGLARRVDAVGRFAGNKFGLVLNNCSEDKVTQTLTRLLDNVRANVIETQHGAVSTTISAGCVLLPMHAAHVDLALARAEEALTAAKQKRNDSFVIYAPSRERERTRLNNINVADELVAALNERRIKLAYQPVVSSANGETMMHECLLRLEQPDGTIVPAGRFISVAEKLGLINLLDYRAMELAMQTLVDNPNVHLSLNVSGSTTSDRMWLETLVSALRNDRSLAERLVIELTETVAIQEMSGSVEFVTTLRDLGCRVAIDDFGAGYTSFRNLKTLDVDLVKIDGSYVQDLLANKDNQFFIRTFVDLARNFNLPTVAEWVGTEEEVAMLRDFGVEYLQGFYTGKPMLMLPAQSGLLRQELAG